MAKKVVTYQKEPMSVCLEKFVAYAAPRDIQLDEASYGFYEIRRKDIKRVLGAVKAIKADGTTGWVINWADKRRRFIPDSDLSVVVGKKVSQKECAKAHKPKKPEAIVTNDTDD